MLMRSERRRGRIVGQKGSMESGRLEGSQGWPTRLASKLHYYTILRIKQNGTINPVPGPSTHVPCYAFVWFTVCTISVKGNRLRKRVSLSNHFCPFSTSHKTSTSRVPFSPPSSSSPIDKDRDLKAQVFPEASKHSNPWFSD